jgi:cobalt/nickel transport system permease protein
MAKIESALYEIGRLDTLANQETWLHCLDPRAKIIVTFAYIAAVVSFNKYELTALLPLVFYPVVLISLGNLPPLYIGKKIALVSPVAIMIGIFNPLFDREIVLSIYGIGVSGGWLSFISIMLRFVLTMGSVIILIAVTGFNVICMALERLMVPRIFVIQLLLVYRYLFVLTEEALRMIRARSMRSFNGGRGMGFRHYADLLGSLLLRTVDRAQRIYLSMLCRSFNGEIRTVRDLHFGIREVIFILLWVSFFIAVRLINFPVILGNQIVGFCS